MRNQEEDMIEIVVDKGKSVVVVEGNSTRKEEFKQFDIIPAIENSISDHHYYGYGGSSKQVNYSKETCKKIMKEWKILKEGLPSYSLFHSIFVRVYKERIDLLRAVIIGPSGTPYQDCLFFFDIQFPSDYPNSPPKVHYHSYGFQLNPNLYSNGYVRLSTINTGEGENSEEWVPNYSSILQVLLSIQALVLNKDPFFNEPGTNRNLLNHQKQSLAYNEYAYILSCKSILGILNNPPKNFEVFVSQHFRDWARAILFSCKVYMKGVIRVSKKFQDLARKAYSNLMKAFMKNGSSLDNFYLIEEEIENDEFSVSQVNQLLSTKKEKKVNQLVSRCNMGPSIILLPVLVFIGIYIMILLIRGVKVGHK